MEFDWDDANIDHIARHHVTPDEAEEALTDPRRIGLDTYSPTDEIRYGVLGRTTEGRILVVIFTPRNGMVRVITARDANTTEKRRQRKQK